LHEESILQNLLDSHDEDVNRVRSSRKCSCGFDVSVENCGSIQTTKMRKKELIQPDAEELMQEAASDEVFLADLNETMEDFGPADQEDYEFLTMDRLAG